MLRALDDYQNIIWIYLPKLEQEEARSSCRNDLSLENAFSLGVDCCNSLISRPTLSLWTRGSQCRRETSIRRLLHCCLYCTDCYTGTGATSTAILTTIAFATIPLARKRAGLWLEQGPVLRRNIYQSSLCCRFNCCEESWIVVMFTVHIWKLHIDKTEKRMFKNPRWQISRHCLPID